MTEIRVEFGVACSFAGAQESERELTVLFRRKQPVAGETDDQRLGFDGSKGLFERAVRVREVPRPTRRPARRARRRSARSARGRTGVRGPSSRRGRARS